MAGGAADVDRQLKELLSSPAETDWPEWLDSQTLSAIIASAGAFAGAAVCAYVEPLTVAAVAGIIAVLTFWAGYREASWFFVGMTLAAAGSAVAEEFRQEKRVSLF